MRLGLYYLVFPLLVFTCASEAQDKIDFGTISAPIIDTTLTSDAPPETAEAPNEETTDKQISLPGMDPMSRPSSMDFKMDFETPSRPVSYRSLEIVSPTDGETIRIHSANIVIKVNVVPPARRDLGHILQITLDNEVVVENQTSFSLDDAERGSRILGLRIVGPDGTVIGNAKSITLNIQ